MARTSLGPWKFVRDMGSSSHWGLIMTPVQEANSDNLEKSFRFSTQWLCVECTHYNRLDEAILKCTHNIQFHDKIRKNPYIFVFLSYWKDFVGAEKRVWIIYGKRAIRVRAIEVILYLSIFCLRMRMTPRNSCVGLWHKMKLGSITLIPRPQSRVSNENTLAHLLLRTLREFLQQKGDDLCVVG